MAFSSSPLVTLVADGLVRLSEDPDHREAFGLAGLAMGTIGLFEKTVPCDVTLPAAFMPRPYGAVTMQDSVQVWMVKTAFDGVVEVPITVVKTGTSPDDFQITLENTGGAGGGCTALTFNLTFVNDGATDPATFVLSQDSCSVTLTITWDATSGLTQPTLAAANTALSDGGYTGTLAGFEDGTQFATANFAASPGNTWSTNQPCAGVVTWNMNTLVGPGFLGPLVLPQPSESPPNVLIGTVISPEDEFTCASDADGCALEIYIRFH